jgi:hypothetical protein
MHCQRAESTREAAAAMSMDLGSGSNARASRTNVRHRMSERMRRLALAQKGNRRQQDKVTNGTALLLEGDLRSAWARHVKCQMLAHQNWMGGESNCSSAELSLIRRCAVLETELMALEGEFSRAGRASGNQIDLYARTSANLRRLFETLHGGLASRPRDIGSDYLDQALAEELGKQ